MAMRRSAWPEPACDYTRLRGWFQCGESAWSLVSKFQLLNCLSLEQLVELVTPMQRRARVPLSFRFAQRFDLARLAVLVDLAPEAAHRAFLAVNHRAPGAPLVARSLRFCKQCLRAGWHLTLSQWRFLRRCPIHRCTLTSRTACCSAHASLAFRLDISPALRPYACPACAQLLAPLLDAPRGRPQSITEAQSQQLEAWTRMIEHYLAAFSPLVSPRRVRPVHKEPECVRARRPRWSFLAEIVGVADRPPPAWPSIAISDIQASDSPDPDNREHAPLPWPAEHWPHFDGAFQTVASLYARERYQLAERVRVDLYTTRLLETHTAPRTIAHHKADPHRLCTDTLAYWLWRAAWEGTSSIRCLHAREHPPLGLAAWLAYAPIPNASSRADSKSRQIAQALTQHLHASFHYAHSLVLWMQQERRLFMIPKLLAPQLWWLASKAAP